jgi:DNA-binding NarL/FixJ family response regulator
MLVLRILVVEDYAPVRRFICAALHQRAEFETIEAADGFEAIQKAERLRPDVILLDISLPKLNGLEAAKRIRRLAPYARLLFVSQETSSDVIRETFRVGGQGYVHKLFAERDLLAAIDAVLAGKRFVSRDLDFRDSLEGQAPHRHEMLFCADDAALVDGMARFIAAALNVPHAVLVFVDESHHDHLLRRLQAQGVDVDAAIRQGTFVVWGVDDDREPGQFFVALKRLREAASRVGIDHPRVAVCGERTSRLWASGKTDEAVRFEQRGTELAKNHDIDMLCVYPMCHGQEDDPALTRICAEHTAVYTA